MQRRASDQGSSPSRPLLLDPVPDYSPEELTDQRGQWLSQLFCDNPQLAALREQLLPWIGGHSFANVVHSDPAMILAHVNRYTVLELVVQHLHSLGMHLAAEVIERESGHVFQTVDQPWDKTDLSLLVSLGVLPQEDPWAVGDDPRNIYIDEFLEEDSFASPYREDPNLLHQELLDPELNIIFQPDKERTLATIRAASLRRLVVILATQNPSDEYVGRFFLVLPTTTTSMHFLEHLIVLFNCHTLAQDNHEAHKRILARQEELQSAAIDIIKKWTYFHGLFIGRAALDACGEFLRGVLQNARLCERFEKCALTILESLPSLTYGMKLRQLPAPQAPPDIPDPQIIFKPALRLTDPSPEEVARQITMVFHAAFKAVHSREFMVALGGQGESYQTPTLSEFFGFGERLTRFALETFITASDKNQTVAQLFEIAARLDALANFDGLASLLRALRRTELCSLPFLQQASVRDAVRRLVARCGDDATNLDPYRDAIKAQYERWDPTIPNLRTEVRNSLADRSPPFIDHLINWEKRWKNSEETAVLYRFQNRPYNFWPISQIQAAINRGPSLTEEQIQKGLKEFARCSK
jgi:hypothetical protein